ncbi:MAG TPA: hypothetical protein VII49_05750 [Rhizomicrobium sp.]
MKTLLALAAAAFIASSAGASARTHTHVITLDGHCDQLTMTITGTLVAGTDDASCEAGIGGGEIGKVKNVGDAIVAGVQFTAKPGIQFVIQLSYPLATGGSWVLFETTDGVTLTELESGTYTLVSDGAEAPRGAPPVTAALDQ